MPNGAGPEALLVSLVPPLVSGTMWLFVTKMTRRMEVFQAQLLFQLSGVPMLLAIAPFAARTPAPEGAGVLLLIGLGALIAFASTLYFHALRVGNLAIVGPLSNTQALVTVPLALVFLKEPVYPLRLAGTAAVIVGIALLALKLGSRQEPWTGPLHRGVPSALVAMVGSGVYQFGVSISDRWNGWYYTSLGIRLVIPVIIVLVLLARRDSLRQMVKEAPWNLIIVAAFLDVLGFSTFNFALTRYEVSYVAVVYAAAPFVSVLLAAICLKERLVAHQAVGLALVAAGVAGISL